MGKNLFDEVNKINKRVEARENLEKISKSQKLVDEFRLAIFGFGAIEETSEYDNLTMSQLSDLMRQIKKDYSKTRNKKGHLPYMQKVYEAYENLGISINDDLAQLDTTYEKLVKLMEKRDFAREHYDSIYGLTLGGMIIGAVTGIVSLSVFLASMSVPFFIASTASLCLIAVSRSMKVKHEKLRRSTPITDLTNKSQEKDAKVIKAMDNDQNLRLTKLSEFKKSDEEIISENVSEFSNEFHELFEASQKIDKKTTKRYKGGW